MSTAQRKAQGLVGIILEDIGLSNDADYLGCLQDTSQSTPETNTSFEEAKKKLANFIENLSEKEKIILSLYYYDELTLKEIGDVMGTTESQACQLHTQATLKLKSQFNGLKGVPEDWEKTNAKAEFVI